MIFVKGVILAAGEGTRIAKVTYGAVPKELLPIGNVPTIRFPLEALKLAGIKDIFVVVAPQSKHNILDGLRSGRMFGVNLCYVVQEKDGRAVGLGPAIHSTKEWIGKDEDFVVACGDSILCDFSSRNPFDSLKPLLKIHASRSPLATLVLHPNNHDPSRFGVAKFRSFGDEGGILHGELEGLVEKPGRELIEAYKCNGCNYVVAGYYAFKPKIFSYIEETKPGAKNEVQITDSIALGLENGEKIYGVVHGRKHENKILPCDYWDVGVPEAYKEANRRLLDADLDHLLS